jgi:hypothetical protein
MRQHRTRRRAPPVSAALHPWIYRAMVGLALVLAVAVWGFFTTPGNGFALTVVSLFCFVAVAIPTLLWQIWRRHPERHPGDTEPESFALWREHEVEIADERVTGRQAAIEALLPIAAVAFGMALFALALHFSVAA